MRLSWQSITLFRMVLRPPRLATTSGFFRAAEAGEVGNVNARQRSFECRFQIYSDYFYLGQSVVK